MDWDRDRRFDDSRRRESYRPGDRPNRSPLRNRSPPRQGADTWVPSNGRSSGRPRSRSPNIRRSSRSPSFRGRDTGTGFPRGRSPPRRFSPRREERQWSPSRPRRSRSPYGQAPPRSTRPSRPRSPPMKRGREPSPSAFNARSPKRERVASPPPRGRYDRPQSPPSGPRQMPYAPRRGGFYPASRTTGRRDPPKEPYEDSWRRRSPSDPRTGRYDYSSGQASTNAPRRNSPPPTRPQRFGSSHSVRGSRSPAHGRPRQNEPPNQSPAPDVRPLLHASDRYPNTPQAPHSAQQRGPSLHPSPPARHAQSPNSQPQHNTGSDQHGQSHQAPIKHTAGNQPTRPLQSTSPQVVNKPQPSPPVGPSAAPVSSSGSSRTANLSLLSAPTRPKGGPGYKRESPRESSGPSLARRGLPSTHSSPPTGPRSTFRAAATNYEQNRPRHSSNTSQMHPRTQRLTSHLSSGPVLVPGGKLLVSGLDPTTEKRLAQLELDKEKLLEQIAEKQKLKRDGLRDWERLETESAVSALRSELADGHLQRMVEGDNIGGGVAF
ncbi:hypothetical protein FQN54_007686 [Arachnomyces sp. PD_36]|nr:hypothetical protein FQN54_007686 [Arachnomyces sp. PD_36]